MLCAISGEAPEEPVVSKKSGAVFEKRLIEKYIEENGKDPVSGEELDLEDLLPIKSARVVRPRPPTLTSIPALLSQFQNEWDSLAIETYNLGEQLARTREELATALYQHDAAVRVIARLTKERDEARDALSKVTVSGSAAANGDAMAVDNDTFPEYLAELVDETQAKLSKSRKKRPVPEGWAGTDDVSSGEQIQKADSSAPGSISLAVGDELTAISGKGGDVAVYSRDGEEVHSFNVGSPITELVYAEPNIVCGTSKGEVKIYTTAGAELASFSEHAGAVTGLALHPGGVILLSVGSDKSFVYYDVKTLRTVFRRWTSSSLTTCAFHPDGHLFAVGTQEGDINVFSTKTGDSMAVFSLGASVSSLVFSENGYWFAAGSDKTPNVTIFDLRKEGDAAKAKELTTTGPVRSLDWDYSAQFLAVAGPGGVAVHHYIKSSKAWTVLREIGEPAVKAKWGDKAKTLHILGEKDNYLVYGASQ
ncbi:Prp19-domain-containing protein [Coniochaeta ligniaria NRRL 30616]|uniref:Pre-mRNA-processing factor 19 n=1 Tax=Coniochaeta ligniaria NRRL 30616 TaxID=1408157 RepID=A0A1J7JXP4_9PEZI|nr:Prp19-domain-containing protein [Coniochaeta ligniaria NRRL 30616]